MSTNYTLQLSTSSGAIEVPQLGGQLVLNGRDAKIHVTDLAVGTVTVTYTTAEVFSISKTESGPVLLLYAGPNELHELAVPTSLQNPTIYGSGVTTQTSNSSLIIQWTSSSQRRVLSFGSQLTIHLLDRNEAYNVWPTELSAPSPIGNFYSPTKDLVILKAGYLVRNLSLDGSSLYVRGDINASTNVELIAAPVAVDRIFLNGDEVTLQKTDYGTLQATVDFTEPDLSIPSLADLNWQYIDTLPEITSSYDDSSWTVANLTTTNNPRQLTTPTNLYAGDYGYHTGSMIYRGHFLAEIPSSNLTVHTKGGSAFGHSIWLNGTFLGSWGGGQSVAEFTQTVALPTLTVGQPYVLTILIDHTGNDQNNPAGSDFTMVPRGILDYSLENYSASPISWKLTGNLGGENYIDKARGPLNEGALYAERNGFHQPGAASATGVSWEKRSPLDGIDSPGVAFYTANFNLSVPAGWDVPLSFGLSNEAVSANNTYRVVLWVNGYQFGKLISNLGPQTEFPVPEGILNHDGTNTVAIALWALDVGGAKLERLELVPKAVVKSSYQRPELSSAPSWSERSGAY